MAISTVLVLGCGYTGEAVARLASSRGLRVIALVRSEGRAALLRASSKLEVVVEAPFSTEQIRTLVTDRTQVVATFPPDGETDARLAPALLGAAAATYVSSTGVYGDTTGKVNDETPVPSPRSDANIRRLAAERVWREVGATVLRTPAIYGPDRGIHRRIVLGKHFIAGDGSSFTSRIHVDDLAQLILASPRAPGQTFVVGDLAPATQNQISSWVSKTYGVPMPERAPREQVHETFRGDRRIDGRRALSVLGVTLAYPSYETGMAP